MPTLFLQYGLDDNFTEDERNGIIEILEENTEGIDIVLLPDSIETLNQEEVEQVANQLTDALTRE